MTTLQSRLRRPLLCTDARARSDARERCQGAGFGAAHAVAWLRTLPLIAVLACASEVTPSDGRGRLALAVVLADGLTARIDEARITLEGPTRKTVLVTPGTTETITGLEPGTYRVSLEGLAAGEVETFGEHTGVVVTAGVNTQVTITMNSFVPVAGSLPSVTEAGRDLLVQYSAVANAAEYRIEWSVDPGFANTQFTTTTATTATLRPAAAGDLFIRVRARTRLGSSGRASSESRVAVLPSGAGGFVGYASVQGRLTVCADCHDAHQSKWLTTGHAGAFATLESAAGRQASCESCHAVSEQGNSETSVTAGWTGTREVRYRDVQCESCHGPGLAHVSDPAAGAKPLARVDAAAGMNGTCAECHSGNHHPFVVEWSGSGHARVAVSPADAAECQSCHEGKAALSAFGIDTRYVEEGTAQRLAITCAVCHDPHERAATGQLRFGLVGSDREDNLCLRCHQGRGEPEITGNPLPHAAEASVLLGQAGWRPPNMPSPGVIPHASPPNPRLCAGCHVQQYQVTDGAAGQLQLRVTGHLFEAIPCLDAQGIPVPGDCALTQRSFRSCTQAGCHGSEGIARSVMALAQSRVVSLNAQLKSMLAKVPASEINPNDNRYTTAEGSLFNAQLADLPGSAVHNPILLEALLVASIQQLQIDYGVLP